MKRILIALLGVVVVAPVGAMFDKENVDHAIQETREKQAKKFQASKKRQSDGLNQVFTNSVPAQPTHQPSHQPAQPIPQTSVTNPPSYDDLKNTNIYTPADPFYQAPTSKPDDKSQQTTQFPNLQPQNLTGGATRYQGFAQNGSGPSVPNQTATTSTANTTNNNANSNLNEPNNNISMKWLFAIPAVLIAYKALDYLTTDEYHQNERALQLLEDIVERGDERHDPILLYKSYVEPYLTLLDETHKVVIMLSLEDKNYEALATYIQNECYGAINLGAVENREKGIAPSVAQRFKRGMSLDAARFWRVTDLWNWMTGKSSPEKKAQDKAKKEAEEKAKATPAKKAEPVKK